MPPLLLPFTAGAVVVPVVVVVVEVVAVAGLGAPV